MSPQYPILRLFRKRISYLVKLSIPSRSSSIAIKIQACKIQGVRHNPKVTHITKCFLCQKNHVVVEYEHILLYASLQDCHSVIRGGTLNAIYVRSKYISLKHPLSPTENVAESSSTRPTKLTFYYTTNGIVVSVLELDMITLLDAS